MPKIIRPYFGDAAAGKNGSSPSSIIYARTSAQVESVKMVTYTKSYKAPIQPNNAAQLIARDKMRQLVLALKAFSDRFVAGSLTGTFATPEGSFISGRSKFISICMKNGIFFQKYNFYLQKVSDLFGMKIFLDDLFQAHFANENIFFAVQIRGDQTNKYFYTASFKKTYADFTDASTLSERDVHYDDDPKTLVVDGDDFVSTNSYTARFWFSLNSFPAPPADQTIDATSLFDIGNSVRMDVPYTVYNS